MNKKEQTIDTYNKSAVAMADEFSGYGARTDDINLALSYINNNVPSILEIGCGNGRDAKEIVKLSKKYLGVDLSEELIKIARRHVPEASFEVADQEKFDFPQKLEIIFSFASLLHSDKENVRNILRKAYEALSVGGIFFISLKAGDYKEIVKKDKFGTRIHYTYSPKLIKELAGDKFREVYLKEHELRTQNWFIIILQK